VLSVDIVLYGDGASVSHVTPPGEEFGFIRDSPALAAALAAAAAAGYGSAEC
jgi:hypothetical protein